ncbi:DUF3618 domain-containing protein [Rhizobium sp. CSW-27]|uniref:DUF3618 domain-containing protein n=1 Tax=Rhizobium sp. CSW-27 TaxID=2839985 RepID=UPI001C0115E1|nr:DUF3618 domain-containing protein [Rhizobium sp. CSW-27]MBT9371475.1 DUF3618 domain-containing protein [Rhizobium sp. CSW-27]
MAYASDTARPQDIEREIEQDRERIGAKLDEIQARMSPGQLIDEAMAYAKSSGGAEFLSNLGGSMKTNPMPVALMGVSLAWLMMGQKSAPPAATGSAAQGLEDDADYPLATVTGPVRRTSPVEDHHSGRYSHFVDATGNRFRAMTDATGRRAGHFVDASGKTYRGFADSAGNRIHDIRDETGKLFDEASGWLSSTWRGLTHSAGRMGRHMAEAGRSAGQGSMQMGASLKDQTARMSDTMMRQFQDQPLIGGALAFALGAAIGAALPRTEQEDEMLGETSDAVKGMAARRASQAMDTAEQTASDLSHRAGTIASDLHDTARDRIAEEAREYRGA